MQPAENTQTDVSIVVPLFNAGATIESCVRSALESGVSQRVAPVRIEVIVSDDGSTDDGPKIVQHIAETDPRVRLLRAGNSGPSAARNRGLNTARGDYVRFLDADDLAAPESSALLVSAAASSGAACGSFELMDAAGRPLGRLSPPYSDARGFVGIEQLQHTNCFGTGAMVIRRDLLDGVRFDESMRYCEDWECWNHLASRGVRWRALPRGAKPVHFYRVAPHGLSRRCADMLAGAARVRMLHAQRTNNTAPTSATASHAMAFASMHAIGGAADMHCETAYQMLCDHVDDDYRCSPQELADATFGAIVLTIDQHPEDLANGARWQAPVAAWWSRLCMAGHITPHDLTIAMTELAERVVHPAAIAAELIDRAASHANAPLTVFGYGQNGHLVVEAAHRKGIDLEIRDDALASDPSAACLCGIAELTVRPFNAPVPADTLAIVTVENDVPLFERADMRRAKHDGLSWRQARTQLAASVQERLERLQLACSQPAEHGG